MADFELTYRLDGEIHKLIIEGSQMIGLAAVLTAMMPAPVQAAPRAATVAPQAERGPVKITGIDIATKKLDGSMMKSPKFTVAFDNGKKYSTFEQSVGTAAKTLWGMEKAVYFTTKMNGQYENLAGIRSADGQP